MNSLMSYGSDDNSEDSADNRFPEMPGRSSGSKSYRKPATHEDNYEEVGMDMSEDSDGSNGPQREEPKNHSSKPDRASTNSFYRRSPPGSSRFPPQPKSGSRSPKYNKGDDERRNNKNEDRGSDDRYKRREERSSRDSREERTSRDSRNDDRSKRDDDKNRRGDDRNRREDDRNKRDDNKSRREDDRSRRDDDRSKRDDDKVKDRYKDDKRDRRDDRYSRDRRDRKRSKSRDRRRSRSPRPSRSPKHPSRSPPKGPRSVSKDKGPRVFTSRREKADKRMDRLDKLGIEFKPDSYPPSAIEEAERNSKSGPGGNRFFMPGITGRFREQIEKRKLLWQKGKEQEPEVLNTPSSFTNVAAASGSKATKVYEATSFADDKTSNKFKRLMGIRETDTPSSPVKTTDVLKKQQEMFSSMEAQYEVARTATHTMRGVGLGFGSFQR